MNDVIALARGALLNRGWATRTEGRLGDERLEFDLIAESPAAIVFIEAVSGQGLRRRAQQLSGEIAAVTLQAQTGAKAWEAYLVLLVTQGWEIGKPSAQEIQRDLMYCRKIVIDAEPILDAEDPESEMNAALGFLFPLDLGVGMATEDVRSHLIDLLAKDGLDRDLVTSLVNEFDAEPDCRCWQRVMRATTLADDTGTAG
jgi:hypothetical protein